MKSSRFALTVALATMAGGVDTAFAETAPNAPAPASAEGAPAPEAGIQDIVVTAQKRQQSINDVGLSITALSGEELTRRNFADVYDLAKLVPGLSVANAGNGATVVYTLRGVGFNASFLSATSAVAVYQDEVALPYPAMTASIGLDLERVEVLKGPQGTLFGQNSTAGAINYISAKPTNKVDGYVSASFGRFNAWDIKGAIGGPLTDTLKVRIAALYEGGDNWQHAYVSNLRLGKRDNAKARAIALWQPVPNLRVNFTVNYWRDHSDSQALQLVRYQPLLPPGLPQLAAFPTAPANDRAAEWNPAHEPKMQIEQVQPSLRIDYDITPRITLTSLSAYSDFRTNSYLDGDGTTFDIGGINQRGSIRDFNQELRLAGHTGAVHWVVGGNLQRSTVHENLNIDTFYLSNVQTFGGGLSGTCAFGATDCDPVFSQSSTHAGAIFANAEVKLSDQFSVIGGARYTRTSINFVGCNQAGPNIANQPVPGVTSSLGRFFNVLYGALTGNAGANPIDANNPNACITLDNISRNGAPPTYLPTNSAQNLTESNVSWNATANFKPNRQMLFYARVAQGYKSGSFPTIGASASDQFLPAKQEGLRDYEAGFKLTLFGQHLQIDGAGFYYDYHNKQLSNFVPDPVFGPLVAIVNVPKSRVIGGELSVMVVPVQGLTLSGAATYADSKIQQFTGYDENGNLRSFQGTAFNLAPKWSGTADADYRFPIGHDTTASIGAGLTYHSSTSGIIGSGDAAYKINSYTLVDLQAGLNFPNGFSAQVWGKNIFNAYYWSNANRISDAIVRVAGRPATYGVTVTKKF